MEWYRKLGDDTFQPSFCWTWYRNWPPRILAWESSQGSLQPCASQRESRSYCSTSERWTGRGWLRRICSCQGTSWGELRWQRMIPQWIRRGFLPYCLPCLCDWRRQRRRRIFKWRRVGSLFASIMFVWKPISSWIWTTFLLYKLVINNNNYT